MSKDENSIATILRGGGKELLDDWVREQENAPGVRPDLISEVEIRKQSEEFLNAFREAVASGNLTDIAGPEWTDVREVLSTVSRRCAVQGFTPTETATFVFSLKQPLFARARR